MIARGRHGAPVRAMDLADGDRPLQHPVHAARARLPAGLNRAGVALMGLLNGSGGPGGREPTLSAATLANGASTGFCAESSCLSAVAAAAKADAPALGSLRASAGEGRRRARNDLRAPRRVSPTPNAPPVCSLPEEAENCRSEGVVCRSASVWQNCRLDTRNP